MGVVHANIRYDEAEDYYEIALFIEVDRPAWNRVRHTEPVYEYDQEAAIEAALALVEDEKALNS